MCVCVGRGGCDTRLGCDTSTNGLGGLGVCGGGAGGDLRPTSPLI